jgi:hypothetical protein
LSELLPGIGTGLWEMMIPKERIKSRVVAAVAKEDWELYFRRGEVFMR